MTETAARGRGLLRAADGRLRTVWRVALGWLVIVVAVGAAGELGGYAGRAWEIGLWWQRTIQAAVTTGVAVPLIYLLCRHADRRPFADVGLAAPATALRHFLVGVAPVAAAAAVPLALAAAAGWVRVSPNVTSGTMTELLAGIPILFFYEAFPEELAMRGYVYRNLSARLSRRVAALAQVGLFMLVPLGIAALQWLILGGAFRVGGGSPSVVEYMVGILVVGTMPQYLRVLCGSIWAGIGFHMSFLLSFRLIGSHESRFIRLEVLDPSAPLDVALLAAALLSLLAVILYPVLRGRSLGWRERDPDPVSLVPAGGATA